MGFTTKCLVGVTGSWEVGKQYKQEMTLQGKHGMKVTPMKFDEYREFCTHKEMDLFPTLTMCVLQYLYMNDTSSRVLKLSLPATLKHVQDHIFSNILIYPLRFMSGNSYVSWSIQETPHEIILWCCYTMGPEPSHFYVNEIQVHDDPSHVELHHDVFHYDSLSHIHFMHTKNAEHKWRKSRQSCHSPMNKTDSEQKRNQVLAEVVSRDVLHSPHIIFHKDIDSKFKLHE